MKIMCLNDSSPATALELHEVAIPTPGPGEVLVRVHATGVTPTELLWYPTTHAKSGAPRRRAVPGHEFSGVVAALGARVANKTGATDATNTSNAFSFAVGEEVYGMNDWFAEGATAEYCITQASSIAPKPGSLSHVEAATVPIGALTAWQGLFDRAKLQPGERVLIHGGSGAVGMAAVQLARNAGAHVITTASARNAEFLAQLGAEKVIDYKTERFEKIARDIDVVFDTVGGDTLQRSWALLKPGGRLVTIASSSEAPQDDRTKAAFFIVEPNQRQLTEIAALLDNGTLKPFVAGALPLAEASAAYFGTAGPRNGRGKVVISVIE